MSPAPVRAASAGDVDAILALWRAAGSIPSVTDRRESVLSLLRVDAGALLVAEDGGRVVGSVIAGWNGWRGSLYRLAVHPEHRRQGVATALVREAERRLRALGAVRVDAIVDNGESVAPAFWEAAGYARQPSHRRHVRTFPAAE